MQTKCCARWNTIFYQMHFYGGQTVFPLQHVSLRCLPPSLPLCLFLSLVPSPSVYFKQSWIIPVYHSAVTKLGMGVLPQSLSARLRRQLLALKIFPIMQTDKGMLFKSPQPICWSLFIYKGLQAASPVKTILDTYVRSLASSPLCFPPSCLLNKVSLRLPQTITFHSA